MVQTLFSLHLQIFSNDNVFTAKHLHDCFPKNMNIRKVQAYSKDHYKGRSMHFFDGSGLAKINPIICRFFLYCTVEYFCPPQPASAAELLFTSGLYSVTISLHMRVKINVCKCEKVFGCTDVSDSNAGVGRYIALQNSDVNKSVIKSEIASLSFL